MAFELPVLPFPKIPGTTTPYIASPDASGKHTVPSSQYFKNASNLWVPVSAADPLPASDAGLQAKVENLESKLDGILDGSTPANAQLTGSTVAKTDGVASLGVGEAAVETVINAASVAAGESVYAVMQANGAIEVWVLLNADQQPWTLWATTIWDTNSFYTAALHPIREAVATTYASLHNPAVSLYMPLAPHPFRGLIEPGSVAEARQYSLVPGSTVGLRVENGSAVTATITVRVIRIWK
ncbi:MAG: hypothetical protein MJA84_07165 [Firmicutes bacterium]|nr:hypothetical protein [Bacillota bacterium]